MPACLQAYPPLPIPTAAPVAGVSVIPSVSFLPTSSHYPDMPIFVLAGQTLDFSLRCTGASMRLLSRPLLDTFPSCYQQLSGSGDICAALLFA